MHSIAKAGLSLFVIASVAAGALGYVNSITAEPIREAELKTEQEKMNQVFECDNWGDKTELDGEGIIQSYTPAVDAGGNTIGYAFKVATQGFGSGLQLMFGVDANGTITGLAIIDCSNETPGLGANCVNEEFYGQFAGKEGALTVTKSGNPTESEIDSLTGATITSAAIVNAANEVTEYFNNNLKMEGGSN